MKCHSRDCTDPCDPPNLVKAKSVGLALGRPDYGRGGSNRMPLAGGYTQVAPIDSYVREGFRRASKSPRLVDKPRLAGASVTSACPRFGLDAPPRPS